MVCMRIVFTFLYFFIVGETRTLWRDTLTKATLISHTSMALYVIRRGRVSAARHAAIPVRRAALAGDLRLGRRLHLQRRLHARSRRAVGHVVAAANRHAGASGQQCAARTHRRGARRRRRHQPPAREPVAAARRAAGGLAEAAISPRLLGLLLFLPPLRIHLVRGGVGGLG